MLSMIIWVTAITCSLSIVAVAVAFDAQTVQLVATALVSLGIVAAAVSEHRAAEIDGASDYQLAALASRYIGILWAWSAVSAYVVYGLLLTWEYWTSAVIAMAVLSGAFLFVGFVLDREAASHEPDPSTHAMAGLLSKVQFIIGVALFGCMITLRSSTALPLGGTERWVALNLFLCAAAALVTLTGYLILHARPANAVGA